MSLRFYDASHRYKLDGEWVPGVTTILGVLDKPGLKKWAASTVAEYVADNRQTVEGLYAAGRGPMVAMLKETPWQRRDDAGARGTKFHDFAERIMRGEEVEVPDPLVPLVEHALQFMEDYQIEPVLNEVPVASREHQYAGKLDLIAGSSLGMAIFDWKSSKRIYPSTALQLVAYARAEFYAAPDGTEHPLPQVEAAYGVHVRADSYDVIPLRHDDQAWADWLTVRAAYAANKRIEGDWRKPGTGYAGAPLTPPTQRTSS